MARPKALVARKAQGWTCRAFQSATAFSKARRKITGRQVESIVEHKDEFDRRRARNGVIFWLCAAPKGRR